MHGPEALLCCATATPLIVASSYNRRADVRRWIARAAFALWVVGIALDCRNTGDPRMPPALFSLTLLPSLAAVVEGFGLAWTVSREYLTRMGGELRIGPGQGGGALATVSRPIA